MRQPGESPEERVRGEPACGVLGEQLGRTRGHRPLCLEAENRTRVGEIDPVGPRVRAALAGDQQTRARYRVDHRGGDLGDGQVVDLGADIERPARDIGGGGGEAGGERGGDVRGVDQGRHGVPSERTFTSPVSTA